MNNNYYANTEYVINPVDFLWKLLTQWKALLLACVVMALLVPSAKYARDKSAYSAELEEQARVTEEAAKPLEERIEARLNDVESNDDVADIRFILQQQDLIELQKDYLAKSVWVNTNPTSQRTLSIKYYMQRGNEEDMQTLIDTYSTYMCSNKVMKDLREAMGIDASLEYIYELVKSSGGGVADDNVDSVVFTVSVVLPNDEIDSDAIAKIVDANLSDIKRKVTQNLGAHSIKRFNIEDVHMFSQDVSDRRTNTSYTINNITNNINAVRERLSEEGKAAYEEINSMRQVSMDAAAAGNSIEISDKNAEIGDGNSAIEPSFSSKYAVIGFILGGILYAGIYLMHIMFVRSICSASTTANITGTRVLGEFYNQSEHIGVSSLLHSDYISRVRYRNRLNTEEQMNKAIASIDAVSEHAEAKEVTLFNFADNTGNRGDELDVLVKGLTKKGIKLNVENVVAEVDEKSLPGVSNAILAVDGRTKIEKIRKVVGLCRDFNINLLGSLYTEEI